MNRDTLILDELFKRYFPFSLRLLSVRYKRHSERTHWYMDLPILLQKSNKELLIIINIHLS